MVEKYGYRCDGRKEHLQHRRASKLIIICSLSLFQLEKTILKSLLNTENEWLLELIETFNGGQMQKFYSKMKQHSEKFKKIKILDSNYDQICQKVSILAFMEIIFQREKSNRNLSFELISKELNFSEDDVEYLVMKSMSLGLVKGTIDQVRKINKR